MAKKHPRSGKPVPGGRVTPKGVRPHAAHVDPDGEAPNTAALPRVPPGRVEGHGRQFMSQPGPTRAGHHRGQR